MSTKIEVIIRPDGSMHVEAHGYRGKACSMDITRLLQSLAADGKNEQHKPEYYESEHLRQQAG